jgi:hypothetical protein
MDYQDVFIADFREGQRKDKDSWLTPNESFQELENVFPYRGVLQKRYGYSVFGRAGIAYADILTGGPNIYTGTLSNLPAVDGSLYVTDGSEWFTDDGLGVLTSNLGGTGTITYATGVISVTFISAPAGPVTAFYTVLGTGSNLSIRGVFDLENDVDSDRLIVMDRNNIFEYNTTTNSFNLKLEIDSYSQVLVGSDLSWNETLSNVPVIAGSVSVVANSETYTDDGAGVLTGSAKGSGSINYTTGEISVTFLAAAAPNAAPYAYYQVDSRGINCFNSASRLIQATQFSQRLYFTDGLQSAPNSSGIWVYDPVDGFDSLGRIKKFNPQTTASPNDKVNNTLLIKSYYQHLIMFNNIETVGGVTTEWRQRARWSKARSGNSILDWRDDIIGAGKSLDADTNEAIVGAGVVKGIMCVAFERSIWVFEFTGRAVEPFRWRLLEGELEIGSTYATIETEQIVIFIGEGGIYGCDGIRVIDLSSKIPDFTLETIKLDLLHLCSAVYDTRLNQILLFYPDQKSIIRCKAIGVQEGWFTDYTYGMNCAGTYDRDSEWTWNTVIAAYPPTASETTAEQIANMTGYELSQQKKDSIVIGGGDNGYVYHLNDTKSNQDYPSGVATPYNFLITSKDYNFFAEQGSQTLLGYVDILNTAMENAAYTIDFIANKGGAYKNQTVTPSGDYLVWKRAVTKKVANSHRFSIRLEESQLSSNSGLAFFKFHAFKIGVKADGSVRFS